MRHNLELHAVTKTADNCSLAGGQGSETVKVIIYARLSTDTKLESTSILWEMGIIF